LKTSAAISTRRVLVEAPFVLRKAGEVVHLLEHVALATDTDPEAIRIGARIRGVDARSLSPNVKVPFKLPSFTLVAPEYSYCAPNLMSLVAMLPGHEPGQGLLELDAVVDARLRRVVLLLDEVLEQQRRLALRQVASVRVPRAPPPASRTVWPTAR
jgi:hypothetical protein